jgi:hypothetical protein
MMWFLGRSASRELGNWSPGARFGSTFSPTGEGVG